MLSAADEVIDDILVMLSSADEVIDNILIMLSSADEVWMTYLQCCLHIYNATVYQVLVTY